MNSNLIKTLVDNQLTPNEYLLLKLIFDKDESLPTYINYMSLMFEDKLDIKDLQRREFVKIIDGEDGELVVLRGRGESLFVKEKKTCNDWIDEWINLFPAGVKSGGKYLRSDRASCLTKMNIFLKKYKYTKEDIFNATAKYLEERKRDNWKYTMCAIYFIFKDSNSSLADWCQNKDAVRDTPKLSEFEQEIT